MDEMKLRQQVEYWKKRAEAADRENNELRREIGYWKMVGVAAHSHRQVTNE